MGNHFKSLQHTVYCAQSGGVAVGGGVYPSGSGPVLASGVRCLGDESVLYLCGNDTVLDPNCTRQRDAGVVCNPGSGVYVVE